jgi:rhomboid protease GluP
MKFELLPIISGLSTLLVFCQPQQTIGWRRVSGVILSILTLGWLGTGWSSLLGWGFWLWVIFIMLPLQGYGQVNRQVTQEQFTQAASWMNWVRWLHPWDGWWDYPQLLNGLTLAQDGQWQEAEAIFQRYQTDNSAIGRSARMMLYRLTNQWSTLAQWVESHPLSAPIWQDPNVQVIYLRALGETERINELLEHLQRFTRSLHQTGNRLLLQSARLYAFAFAGDAESVAWLIQQYFTYLNDQRRQDWLNIANNALPGRLSPNSRQYLNQLKLELLQEQQPSIGNLTDRPKLREIPVTSSLIAINVGISLFFYLAYAFYNAIYVNADYLSESVLNQFATASAYTFQLYEAGVLFPNKVFQGQWWRLLTAAFLHAGWFHLFSNMLGLYILGSIVEPILGRWRYAIGYLVTGISSMGLVSYLSIMDLINEDAVVGASGAIMGLLGMMGAIFLIRWQQKKEAMAAQQLRSVVMIAGFQTVMDAITPQVSMAGHLSGLVLGFIVGLLLVRKSMA